MPTKLNNRPLLIYVAGPYSAVIPDDIPEEERLNEAPRFILKNINTAIQVGIEVIKRGHIAFVPHLTYYLHMASPTPLPKSFWYNFDNEMLDRCDAILHFAPSHGADKELARAKKNGQIIFTHISQVPNLYTQDCPQDFIEVVYRSDESRPVSTQLPMR